MDPTATVYQFELYDPHQRRWRKAEAMATAAAIEREGGVPMRTSALVVDASRVDARGYLRQEHHDPDRPAKAQVDTD